MILRTQTVPCSVFIITVFMASTLQSTDLTTLFAQDKADLYWEALVQIARGNKEAALQIVAAIQKNTPVTITPAWKEQQPQDINAFFDKLFVSSVARDPQTLSFLGLFESIGLAAHNAYLNDVCLQASLRTVQEAKANLDCLKAYSLEGLSPDQKISHKIFSWMLEHAVAGEKFLLHDYTINQFTGVLTNLTVLLTQFHRLETPEDVEQYMVRLSAIPRQLQQAIAFIELQKDNGILPPRFAVEKVISIIQRSIPEQITDNAFYLNLAQHIDAISVDNPRMILERAQQIVQRDVYPAYRMVQSYFTQLLDHVHENNGVWALPDGDAYYAYTLYNHTTTNASADAIHELGLQEVAKIHQEMRRILAAENRNDPDKSVGALVQELSKNSDFYYPNTDAGRAQCLADYQTIVERSRKELGHLFNLKPRAGVQIKRVPPHEEEGAPGAYYWMPSADGSRPGIFFANLRDMAETPNYSMETLAIHEAEPGHHFQLALQYEMDIPMQRKLGTYTAYCEGWALYVEKLAYEHGFYSSSFSQLGHLKDELLRAARLVVDTGIHHKRWTREQAIAYMCEATGYHYNSVVSEVERYFVLPGQACAYKIGQLKILELRQRAKDALGDRFDICDFHDVILRVASVPLTVLEEVIDQYIREKLRN